MIRPNVRRRHGKRGMTLVELLAVMAVMTIALTLVAGSYQSFSANVEISNSIQQVGSTLDLAKQLATSRNQYAQVRFLSPQSGDTRAGQYTAIAVYLAESPLYGTANAGLVRQSGKTIQLPASTVVANDATYSPLLAKLKADADLVRVDTVSIGGITYDSVAFYFKPDGSLDVNYSAPLSLTICPFAKYSANGNKPDSNYAVVTIDRISGRFQTVRP